MLTFEELAKANKLRSEDAYFPIGEWTPQEWSNAMAGECGEVCNLTKKLKRDAESNKRVDPTKIGLEIADVVIYADLLAQRLGFKLESLVRTKFNLTSEKVRSSVKIGVKIDI